MLDEYPRSIENALAKAGLGWKITHGDVLVVKTPEWTDDFGTKHPPELIPAKGFKANVREDPARSSGSSPTNAPDPQALRPQQARAGGTARAQPSSTHSSPRPAERRGPGGVTTR
jgi:hypothetical protein